MNDLGFGKQRLINEIIKQTWNVSDTSKIKFSVNDVMFILQELQDNEGRRYLENGGNKIQSFNVFKMFAQQLLYRNIANYDSMVLLTASKGAGKSSFAILLAREWCRLLGIRFDPRRHIAYNNADIMDRLDKLQKFEPLIMDEGVRFASSSDWNLKESKILRKRISEVRTKHHLMILCFPLKIGKVEKTFLDSFINYWCLKGTTKINVLDIKGVQRKIAIKDLNKRYPKVLSYNENKDLFEYKKYGKKIKTKKNAQIYELELENGIKIKCTEDHPFLTKKGWVQLKDIIIDDEIKIYTKKCKECNQDFVPIRMSQLHCTKQCASRHSDNKCNHKKYMKIYNKKNKEKLNKQCTENYKRNREERLKYARNVRETDRKSFNQTVQEYRVNNRELVRKNARESRKRNIEHYKIKAKEKRIKRETNPSIKKSLSLRRSLNQAIKSKETTKRKAVKYLGCSFKKFKKYIEELFEQGMSWKNYGEWHIDHIKPCCLFDLTKEEQIYECFHYSNLQPLWAKDNLIKGDKYFHKS